MVRKITKLTFTPKIPPEAENFGTAKNTPLIDSNFLLRGGVFLVGIPLIAPIVENKDLFYCLGDKNKVLLYISIQVNSFSQKGPQRAVNATGIVVPRAGRPRCARRGAADAGAPGVAGRRRARRGARCPEARAKHARSHAR